MPIGNHEHKYDPPASELLSIKAAARLCGLSERHLRKLAKDGEVWAVKPGYEWLTTLAAVNEYQARDIRPGRKSENRSNE